MPGTNESVSCNEWEPFLPEDQASEPGRIQTYWRGMGAFCSANIWPLCSTVGTMIDRRSIGMLNVNVNKRSVGWR